MCGPCDPDNDLNDKHVTMKLWPRCATEGLTMKLWSKCATAGVTSTRVVKINATHVVKINETRVVKGMTLTSVVKIDETIHRRVQCKYRHRRRHFTHVTENSKYPYRKIDTLPTGQTLSEVLQNSALPAPKPFPPLFPSLRACVTELTFACRCTACGMVEGARLTLPT